jgi:hypothetical protein
LHPRPTHYQWKLLRCPGPTRLSTPAQIPQPHHAVAAAAGQHRPVIGLAAPALDTSWEDLLGPDGGPGVPADWSTIAEMRKILGLPADPALPNPARFPTGGL